MKREDPNYYKNIGFMCGLEVHQRLATAEKLFCHCSAIADESDNIAGSIFRYQRAVAGELGQIDRSAEFEEMKNRKFNYTVKSRHTCLIEIDEEPPQNLNQEALKIALSFAKAMKMKLVDELEPMRKEVVDGSDPSAFQRTVLVGLDGEIKVKGQAIKMPTLFLEEESSSIVSTKDNEIFYDTERLGVPLVEIDTDPYIPTPEMAKEVALYIGTLIRVSGKVQRGIGSIRQDVNVSITGGNRVEIKGLQEVDMIDKFVENEIIRQQSLLEIKEHLKKAKATVDRHKDITELLKGSEAKIVKAQLEKGGVAFGFRLKGFKGYLGKEINPQRRLGSEISDYAKMARVNGLIHSDENLKGYGFTDKEISEINKNLEIGENDAFVIIAGKKQDVERASELAIERAKYALVGVPLETRATANNDLATTRFMRPLPSGSRMYPETDASPTSISLDMIQEAMENTPDVEMERGILYDIIDNKEIAEQLVLSPKLHLFKTIIKTTKAEPNFVANILLQKFTELRRNGVDVDSIDKNELIEIFEAYHKNRITKQAVDEILREIWKRKHTLEEIIINKKLERIAGKELTRLVDSMKKDGISVNELRNTIMEKYRINVDGAELNEILAEQKEERKEHKK